MKKEKDTRKGILIGFYKSSKLIKVFKNVSEAAKYFDVSYGVLSKSLDKKTEVSAILKSNESLKKIHPNTYYKFYTKAFAAYIKPKSKESLKQGCDTCLKANKLWLPYNGKFQQFGNCDYCQNNNQVSIGILNKWLRNQGILLDKRSHRNLAALLPRPNLEKIAPEKKEKSSRIIKAEPIPEAVTVALRKKEEEPKKLNKPKKVKKEKSDFPSSDVLNKRKEIPPKIKEESAVKSVGCVLLFAAVLFGFLFGLQQLGAFLGHDYVDSLKENPVQSVKGVLLKKQRTSDGGIMVYRNIDNQEWIVNNCDSFYNNAEVGDSIRVYYIEEFPSIIFKNIEKLNP